MRFISTRDSSNSRSFSQVVLEGLARDGGLFVPESIPDFSGNLDGLKSLSYQDLAFNVFKPFAAGCLKDEELKTLIDKSYQSFKSKEVAPLSYAGDVAILELFHGPTFAFKDVALQFLGNLFESSLSGSNRKLNILGATSGDTGSAAIHGVRGKSNINIFMLHPKGLISPIQEKQMTTVLDDNVFNIAVHGTFDDCQRIVKEVFTDLDFRDSHSLGAVNSINWARVMAQIVYYFYATFRFQENHPGKQVVFSVPTGNFGDIYAGYLAKKMGLPIKKLILATNENDILYRAVKTGVYEISSVQSTISPSMDIQVASNFERFIFDLTGRKDDEVRSLMTQLKEENQFVLSDDQISFANEYFDVQRIDTAATLDTIRKYNEEGLVLDPHTAVGIAAAENSEYRNVICLATAHPCKFGEAVEKAIGQPPEFPKELKGILEKKSRCVEVENDYKKVEEIIADKLAG